MVIRNADQREVKSHQTCILTLLILLIGGCSDLGEPVVAPPPDLLVDQLLAVPETTMVQGRQLYLSASMWRGFMPVSPPHGSSLAGVVFITALDSLPIAGFLSSDAVWIVYQHQVWKSWFSSQPYPMNELKENQFARIFNNGPKWGPNVFVDVIARVLDTQGNLHLVRASNQWIGRTD
jgi:hypothetical protein